MGNNVIRIFCGLATKDPGLANFRRKLLPGFVAVLPSFQGCGICSHSQRRPEVDASRTHCMYAQQNVLNLREVTSRNQNDQALFLLARALESGTLSFCSFLLIGTFFDSRKFEVHARPEMERIQKLARKTQQLGRTELCSSRFRSRTSQKCRAGGTCVASVLF